MRFVRLIATMAAVLGLVGPAPAAQSPAPAAPSPGAPAADAPKVRTLPVSEDKPWKGDFDRLLERRMIRVMVPFSRTLYFNDRGRERGLTGEFVRDFEQYVNRKYKTGNRPLTVYIVPTTRDRLLSNLEAGRGDLAAGNLTITEERLKLVDFTPLPLDQSVSEVVLTGPKSPAIASVDDLSGKTVHVRKSSSYFESLTALNARLGKAGKPPAKLVLVPDALEDEDMMEMLNAGLFELIVVDDWKAKLWAQVLPNVKVSRIAVHEGGQVGWAMRKDSPKLGAALTEFFAQAVKKEGVMAYRFAQFNKQIRQIANPTASEDTKRFQETLALFNRYAPQYGFDAIMLAAQGYQESRLDQSARSHVGAVGIMQIMPATGAELKVGDIKVAESNVHAGAKYMDRLMTRYFQDAHFTEANRTLFAFASYNAGPGSIAKARKEAETRGLDPDRWFNHVEVIVAEKIGREPVTYVRNIYKYYVAYILMIQAQAEQKAAREQVAPGKR
ncbi:MAG TPA: transporter substrate-binding domain-containing protein [Methylomirabilota bacterium]|nr:transporter substrate-binding domain-containing protein [Methylomirabilota bacterium]